MTLKGISITQLNRINVEGGDVLRGLRSDDDDYNGFAELISLKSIISLLGMETTY